MRHFVFSWVLLAVGFTVFTPGTQASTHNAKRFNVLFIALDVLRPDLGC
jgi:hypothetical protein